MSDIATPGWIIGNLVAIGFNTLMLHGGFRVESGRVENERETLVLVASCLPFVFAFLPSTIFVAESYSVEGFLVLLFTFLVWALYAVNALANRNDVEGKASIYNLLDVRAHATRPLRACITPALTPAGSRARRSSPKTSSRLRSRFRCWSWTSAPASEQRLRSARFVR